MSDSETLEKPFAVERAKTGRAKCKKCKEPIDKDTVRIAKLMSNPFGEGKMKHWHHVDCLFDVFAKQRAATKKIDDPDEDIEGWNQLSSDDKKIVIDKLKEFDDSMPYKNLKRQSNSTEAGPSTKKLKESEAKNDSKEKFDKPSSTKTGGPATKTPKKTQDTKDNDKLDVSKTNIAEHNNRDDSFRAFRKLCLDITAVSAYTEKTACIKKMFTSGFHGDGFTGNLLLWCKLLLPMAIKRVYNVQNKQLIKLFSRIFHQSEEEMLEDFEQGDIGETIMTFMKKSSTIQYSSKSLLTLQEIDDFLEKLSQLTKEDEQSMHLRSIVKRCTPNDLKMIIRLIKNDLRTKCGPKHVLEAIHEDAHRSYQHTNNLEEVVKKFAGKFGVCVSSTSALTSASAKGKVALSVMTPVLPMLAEACKSVEMAIKKCPNGMLSEIKYDGERVQVHKHGNEFRYFSRSLKPVMPHKVKHFEQYIPEAFPSGEDLILDSEILMIDRSTGKLLPFGSLGGKKTEHNPNVNVCIYIFDCIYYNGEQLLTTPMKERRKILEKRIQIIPNRVMLSEVQEVHDPGDLSQMIAKVFRLGLEGLVLKPTNSVYEPGKRHWLKVKKDYLFDGAMADSADLVVLGAWYGTGKKGGIKSIFLMGCYDEDQDVWLTVTKVHSGHDDATLAKLQNTFADMIKISKDPGLVPSWIKVNKPMIPDFIAKDPKAQPVWEITGAEFTDQGHHTAEGISIRFPRVSKIRDDKNWSTATTLNELRKLFKTSSDSIDCSRLLGQTDNKKKPKKTSTLDNFLTRKNNNKDESMDIDDHQCEDKEKKREIFHVEKAEIMTDNNELPAFYAFIDKDYIEYDAAGNPLNWIENRKPMTGLPENAKPLSEKCDAELRSKGIIGKVSAILDSNIPKNRREILQRTLTTLGAEVRKDNPRSGVTHIIHGVNQINMTDLRKYQLPLARHVNESWIEAVVATSRMQDEGRHAVKLINSEYCDCSCAH